MSKRKLPNHILGTFREWQTRKRRELDAAIKALYVFRLGCAYTPADKISRLIDQIEIERKKLSKKAWK